jgi:hypothetical protein
MARNFCKFRNIQCLFTANWFLLYAFLLFFLSACNNGSRQGANSGNDSDANQKKSTLQDPQTCRMKLNKVYLENWASPGHNQLEQLFLPKSKKVDKLIFSLAHNKSNELVLAVLAAEHQNQNFDTKAVQLTQVHTAGFLDLSGTEVLLGELETNDKVALDAIIAAINRADSKYIFFTPVLETVDGKHYIDYKVEGGTSLAQPLYLKSITTVKPCPPYSAY